MKKHNLTQVPPLVSILIPAYNAQSWLAETVESALAQTYSHKEIIIVDDGSKDGTLALARRFIPRGVTVATQSNSGAAAARNKAFTLCHGDYVQWLDADDLLAPDKIASQMAEFPSGESCRVLLSSSWGYFRYRLRKAEFVPSPLWEDLSPVEWLRRKLEFNLHMQTATWLVSRELTEAAGPWDTRLLGDDDGEYFCRVLLASERVRFVPGAKVFYRRNRSSLSYIGRSVRKMETQFLSMKMHIGYLRSLEESARVRAACIAYLQRYLIYFYPEHQALMREAQELAAALGGKLENPRLPTKYQWIQKLFGWEFGKRIWVLLPKMKESLKQQCDKALFQIEARKLTKQSRQGAVSRSPA